MQVYNVKDVIPFLCNNKKTVFITGATGQDGSHMIDYLLENTNHNIIGGARRLSTTNHENIKHLIGNSRFRLVNFDLTDAHSIYNIVENLKPDYFINLAAQSFVGSSWDFPAQTWECNTTGVIHILEAIKQHKPSCRFYNAGSSEEYGNVSYTPQDENHPSKPRSPYGASKSAARQLVKVYRESYNLYAIQGLLFNHEGTRRGEEFVTRKITKGVARIKKAIVDGKSFDPIELGNVKARRDWSDAEDFVDGIWRMLNQEEFRNDLRNLPKGCLMLPGEVEKIAQKDLVAHIREYVLSSNETHTISEFVWYAFKAAEIMGVWHGEAESSEFSISTKDAIKLNPMSSVLVKINPKFYRPAEVDLLLGDSTKARTELKWDPKTSFEQLVEKMVRTDLKDVGL
jgi:GDPmannose 4,6-dehydratase